MRWATFTGKHGGVAVIMWGLFAAACYAKNIIKMINEKHSRQSLR